MTPRVALIHDWLTGMRGGEKVLEVLCERFPGAELFTLVHVPGSVSPIIGERRVHTSALQWLPGIRRYYRQCLPVFPTLIEQFDLDPFDLVISTSHCAAKSVVARPGAVHICYCLTPMRYAWDQFDAYFGPERLGRIGSAAMRRVMARLARWDRDTAVRASRYVAISHYVAGRIGRYYNREAIVVYPPVDTDFFHPGSAVSEGYALVVAALVPYKRIDLAIAGCALAGVPLKIVGSGPERDALERYAREVPREATRDGTREARNGARDERTDGGGVEFLGRCSDDEIRELYRRSAVVLMPGEEDFGIVPLEAQACGRPVVALGKGGATETILSGDTGILVESPTPQAFADAIGFVMDHPFDSAAIRRHAERFGWARFGDEIEAIVAETLEAAQW